VPAKRKPIGNDLDDVLKRANKFLAQTGEEKRKKVKELLKKQEVHDSGKQCHCGGKIVRIKSWAIRLIKTDVIGGDCYRELEPKDLIEEYTPYHCQNCGIQYFKLP
jgi:hypothetical protein